MKFYKKLLSENKLTKKRFRQGARTIKYPGDDKKRIILALKSFGIRIDDLEDKILPIVISDFSTDTENPAIITTNVINDGGKFYLISFIRFSRYGLEEVYTKDFCQIYKVN